MERRELRRVASRRLSSHGSRCVGRDAGRGRGGHRDAVVCAPAGYFCGAAAVRDGPPLAPSQGAAPPPAYLDWCCRRRRLRAASRRPRRARDAHDAHPPTGWRHVRRATRAARCSSHVDVARSGRNVATSLPSSHVFVVTQRHTLIVHRRTWSGVVLGTSIVALRTASAARRIFALVVLPFFYTSCIDLSMECKEVWRGDWCFVGERVNETSPRGQRRGAAAK